MPSSYHVPYKNNLLLRYFRLTTTPCSYSDTLTSGVNLTQRRRFHSCTGRREKRLSRAVVVYEEGGVRVVARESREACGWARALQSDTARPQCARVRCSLFVLFFVPLRGFRWVLQLPRGLRTKGSWLDGEDVWQVGLSSMYFTPRGVRQWTTDSAVGSVSQLGGERAHWKQIFNAPWRKVLRL